MTSLKHSDNMFFAQIPPEIREKSRTMVHFYLPCISLSDIVIMIDRYHNFPFDEPFGKISKCLWDFAEGDSPVYDGP